MFTLNRIAGYWKAAGWLLVLAIITLSLTPSPPHLNLEQGDKLGHFAAYGMVALGIALEYAQRAAGYRSFEVADMVADALGVAIGWLAAPPRLPNFLSWAEKRLRH